ncbi:MAG: N-acetylmuramoyl-L-alanine amidase [candidate division Zixibacteria bacterium]|nr:N-acetylmuramoyl-L-alanine amidase [candidate division Zixibacteria bacterium]
MTDFFDQLTEFSRRVFRVLDIGETTSPWTSGQFRDGRPIGAVLHYTAGNDIDKTLAWFMEYQSRTSAHVVVADGWPEGRRELCENLPLIHALPAMVVQCVPPDRVAWHATWANTRCYGIEAVNMGELRRLPDGTFVSWHRGAPGASEWTRPWEHPSKKPLELFGRWWEPWTPDQLQAIAIVLHEVQESQGMIKPAWILGHENMQGEHTLRYTTGMRVALGTDKRDPGPAFPLEVIRETVLESVPMIFSTNPLFGFVSRSRWIQEWYESVKSTGEEMLWGEFYESLSNFVDGPGFGSLGKLCLRILGYHISNVTTDDLTEEDLDSVWIFQRMMGLETDRQPGPKTRRALVERLVDRGLGGP